MGTKRATGGSSTVVTPVAREVGVDRNTARLLSQATYHQLVLAIREIVANAHDAAAPNIDITVNLEKKDSHVLVKDNGDGMTRPQFDNDFLHLGRTTKPSGPRRNKFGRPILGRFGVGFIAAVPFAQELIVESKSRDDKTVHGVRIICANIVKNVGPGGDQLFKFDGWERTPDKDDAANFTAVRLKQLTPNAYDSLDTSIQGGWYQFRSKETEAEDRFTNEQRLQFIRDWLGRILPLGYPDPPKKPDEEESDEERKWREHRAQLLRDLGKLLPSSYAPAQVSLNGSPIERVLADAIDIDAFEKDGDGWACKGVLWSPRASISPPFMRGVAIRVGDMAIGEPSYLTLGAGVGRWFGKLHHITGEIQVEGLDEYLQLDRQRFYHSPPVTEFRNFVEKRLASFDSRLQKKAQVMQGFRNLRKSANVEALFQAPAPDVAPILRAPETIADLKSKAAEAGIVVRASSAANFDVPKGEKEVTIGDDFVRRLMEVKSGGARLTIKVKDRDTPLTNQELCTAILDGPKNALVIQGSHILIAKDEWAMANVRLFAALRHLYVHQRISRKVVQELIDQLVESYS